jgi:hypothetical protein
LPNVSKPQPSVMAEQETVWKIDPHTQAKHRILQRYLQAWLPIMSKYNGRLVIVDGFAGPGVRGSTARPPVAAAIACSLDYAFLLAIAFASAIFPTGPTLASSRLARDGDVAGSAPLDGAC